MDKYEFRVVFEPVTTSSKAFLRIIRPRALRVSTYSKLCSLMFEAHLILSHSVSLTFPSHIRVMIFSPETLLAAISHLEDKEVTTYFTIVINNNRIYFMDAISEGNFALKNLFQKVFQYCAKENKSLKFKAILFIKCA